MAHTRVCAAQKGALTRLGTVSTTAPAASASDSPSLLATTSHLYQRQTSTTPYSHDLRIPYRCSRRHFGSPWFCLINVSPKRLKLPMVNPCTTLTLSAFAASLVPCRILDALFSYLAHATINLQLPSHTVMYQAPGSKNYEYRPLVRCRWVRCSSL